jgi:hypothetical protein
MMAKIATHTIVHAKDFVIKIMIMQIMLNIPLRSLSFFLESAIILNMIYVNHHEDKKSFSLT